MSAAGKASSSRVSWIPSIEYHDDRRWPEARSAFGTAAFLERFDEVLEVLGDDARSEVEQLMDARGDRVVLIFRFTGRARTSGIRHDYRWAFCAMSGRAESSAYRHIWSRGTLSKRPGLSIRRMSEENVEVVMEGIRRFESFDLDGVTRLWHPDGRITGPRGWPEPGPFEGRDAVIGQFRRLAAGWGQQRVSDVKVIGDSGDWVVVTFRWEVEGDKSGADTAASFAGAYRVEDGQMREAHFRRTPAEALAAAGLSE